MPFCFTDSTKAPPPLCGSKSTPNLPPYHDASEQADSLPTVGVWDHVTIANGEEGDGDEPHGTQEVAGYILLVMVPTKETQTSVS